MKIIGFKGQSNCETYLSYLSKSESIEKIECDECKFSVSENEVNTMAEMFSDKGVKITFDECSYEVE